MTYYFISFDSSKFRDFPERFPALAEGKWIKSEDDLKAALKSPSEDGMCFFVDLPLNSKETDRWVMVVRDASPDSKIIYVTGDQKPQDLKAHQISPVGGDAYISKQVSAENLQRILAGFKNDLTNVRGNKLERSATHQVAEEFEMSSLMELKRDPLSHDLDDLFNEAIPQNYQKPKFQSISNFAQDDESGESMSDKDQDLGLDDLDELELSDAPDLPADANDQGMDMDLDSGLHIDLGNDDSPAGPSFEDPGTLDLGGDDLSLSLGSDTSDDDASGLVLSDNNDASGMDFSLDGELSPDAKDKLAEIDAIMTEDSKINLAPQDLDLLEDAADLLTGTGKPDAAEMDLDSLDLGGVDDSLAVSADEDQGLDLDLSGEEGLAIADIPAAGTEDRLDSDLDQPLVSEDLDLANLDFGTEPEPVEEKPVVAAKEAKAADKPKKKKETREEKEEVRAASPERPMGQELREISGAYSAELERMQATLSNLRSDREELLAKIQTLEEEKHLHNRQALSMRAELDEKKIELSIVRKKLNEDISELKDRLRLEEERRLILEEKNRVFREELEKSAQKNRFDVKKVQLRERELEQKLELLKADAETQIRNRDLKILELKRKIDGMEFDMESMQSQEKRTVESRFELEDKLEKAIKTLRSAISVLEDETDKGAALEALKKNIEM